MVIDRTGNSFTDSALCSIAALADKDYINKLSLDDLENVLHNYDIADINKNLKCFTIVLGNNGPLCQNAFKGKNKELYHEFLMNLFESVKTMEEKQDEICEICGRKFRFDINGCWKKSLDKYGFESKDEKYIGRDFFPLIGSIGNDAQIFPSASRVLHVCPFCLFVVNFLPVGTMLMRGRLICLESNCEELMVDLIRQIVKDNLARYRINKSEIKGAKQGAKAFIEEILKLFLELRESQKEFRLPEHSSLYVWLFSNSGTGPDCDLIEVPNRSLNILKDLMDDGRDFSFEVFDLIRKDKYDTFLECLKYGNDFRWLYPYRKEKGVSPGLFSFYQQRIRSISCESLKSAYLIAKYIIENSSEKDRQTWQKSDVFSDVKNKNEVRKIIALLIEQGLMSFENYTELFPAESIRPLTVKNDGWNLIMYYLYNFEEVQEIKMEKGVTYVLDTKCTDPRIKQFAELYFEYYVLDRENGGGRGIERFKRDILDNMKNRDERWLKDAFARMAEVYGLEYLTYDEWVEWCHDENGRTRIFELLFQLRLAFANLYNNFKKNNGGV